MSDTREALGREAVSYATVLDALPIAAFMARPDGAISYLSRTWETMTGLDAARVIEDGYASIIAPSDLEETVRAWTSSLADGSPYDAKFRIRFGSGDYRWIVAQAAPLFDATGEILSWFGTSLEIDDQVRRDERLRSEAELTEKLIESSADCIKILDLDARLLSMSRRGQELLAISDMDSVINGPWPDFFLGDENAAALEAIRCALRLGVGKFTGSYAVRDETLWFDITVTSIVDALGRPEKLLVISHDVTSERRTSDELRASEGRYRRIALELQGASLPVALPQSSDLSLSAFYRPGSDEATIGGDWYDAFALDDGRIALTIGDVLGHGLHAAVTMTKLRQAMQAAAMTDPDPNVMLRVADKTMRLIDPDSYATALAAIYDPLARTLTLASAGHPGPFVRAPGTTHARDILDFSSAGPMLGLRDGTETRVTVASLEPESTVVFFTDGLVEATRDINAGCERVKAAMCEPAVLVCARPAELIAERVLGSVAASDDVAILVLTLI